ncbi:MAG: hypothetical protein IIA67_04300 [Planctomycetes bacterium]|nr:hypothetical protein [Planctomycetota bacterium]
MTIFRISVCMLAVLALAATSHADIDVGEVTDGEPGAVFEQLFPPPLGNPFGPEDSVGSDNFQSDNLFGFNELQEFTLTEPLSVDMLVDGAGGLAPGVLPAGTTVASHYIFFDSKELKSVQGNVRFDQDILAVITTEVDLDNSDFLGHPSVHYISKFLRGLEGDTVTWSGPNEITVSFTTATPGDYIRVLTEVPEPSTLLMASMFAVCMAGAGRWRRKRSSS